MLMGREPEPTVEAQLCFQLNESSCWPSYQQRLTNSVWFQDYLIPAITYSLGGTTLMLHIYIDYKDRKDHSQHYKSAHYFFKVVLH